MRDRKSDWSWTVYVFSDSSDRWGRVSVIGHTSMTILKAIFFKRIKKPQKFVNKQIQLFITFYHVMGASLLHISLRSILELQLQ